MSKTNVQEIVVQNGVFVDGLTECSSCHNNTIVTFRPPTREEGHALCTTCAVNKGVIPKIYDKVNKGTIVDALRIYNMNIATLEVLREVRYNHPLEIINMLIGSNATRNIVTGVKDDKVSLVGRGLERQIAFKTYSEEDFNVIQAILVGTHLITSQTVGSVTQDYGCPDCGYKMKKEEIGGRTAYSCTNTHEVRGMQRPTCDKNRRYTVHQGFLSLYVPLSEEKYYRHHKKQFMNGIQVDLRGYALDKEGKHYEESVSNGFGLKAKPSIGATPVYVMEAPNRDAMSGVKHQRITFKFIGDGIIVRSDKDVADRIPAEFGGGTQEIPNATIPARVEPVKTVETLVVNSKVREDGRKGLRRDTVEVPLEEKSLTGMERYAQRHAQRIQENKAQRAEEGKAYVEKPTGLFGALKQTFGSKK